MLLRVVTLLVALVCVLFVCPDHAHSKQPLHWSDIEDVIDRHPEMQLIKDEVSSAKAEVAISSQYPNPEIGGSIGQSKSHDGKDSALIWGVELEIPIETSGNFYNETRAAKAGLKASKLEAGVRILEIKNKLKGLFYKIAIGQKLLEVQTENLAQLGKLVNIAKKRVELGEAREMEALRLEIEYEKLQLEVNSSKRNLDAVKKGFNVWFGNKLDADYTVEINWQDLPEVPDLNTVVNKTNSQHPLMKAASLRLDASKSLVKAEKHRVLPDLSIGGFYENELDSKSYGGMLSMKLPVWNWNGGSIAKARAENDAAKHEKELLKFELTNSIFEAHSEAVQAISKARAYNSSILPKARKTNKAVGEMYRVGEANIADVIDTRRSQIEIETETLGSYIDGWLAYLNFITLVGGDYE